MEKSSEFSGGLKHFAIAHSSTNKIYLCGGVSSNNHLASNVLYEINLNTFTTASKKKPMDQKRYGHSAMYIKGIMYVMGGYTHKNMPGETPQTTK